MTAAPTSAGPVTVDPIPARPIPAGPIPGNAVTPGPVTAGPIAAGGPSTAAGAERGPAAGQARNSVLAWRRPGLLGRPAASDPVFVATSLAELILAVGIRGNSPTGVESISSVITEAATTLMAGAEEAGIAFAGADRCPELRAGEALPANVRLLMKAEDHTAQGPCLAAAGGAEQVLVHDLRTDGRWPLLAARSPWAVRSVLCTPLVSSAATTHVLVVLSTRAWAFDDTSTRLAKVLAAHAALALAHAEHTRHLHAMADSRDLIGQAKGILMQRHRLTADQAFRALTQASNDSNIKLIAVCRHLADTGEFPARKHQPTEPL